MQKEFDALHLGYTDFETFVRVIPFQFYAIGTLFMIPIVALTGREFGAMFRAEKRAIELNQPYAPGSQTARTTIDTQDVHPGATYNMMLLPLIVLFVTIFGLLIPQGFPLTPIKGAVLRSALCTGYLLGAFVCMLLMVKNKVATFKESFGMYRTAPERHLYSYDTGARLGLRFCLQSAWKANFIVELAGAIFPHLRCRFCSSSSDSISFATGSS
ncbi:MAG: Na+/H+ antiporter NhaC family protein [Cloacibacillus evryensis]